MSLESLKGTKEFLPEKQILRNQIIETLRKNFELFGFKPLETPSLELFEALASKYSGGAEILKETYKLKDQGERNLALRYDLTVPLAILIGQNPQLRFPFKRYEIGKVFRDGPVKTGRLREFTQCDVDVIGCNGQIVEMELLDLALKCFKELELDVVIKINNRKLLNGLMSDCGIENNKIDEAILAVDKLDKLGWTEVEKELQEKKIGGKSIARLQEALEIKGSNAEKAMKLRSSFIKDDNKEGLLGLSEVKTLIALVELNGLTEDVEFDISLARGLSYYTGTVFEVYVKDSSFKSAIAAGGRWDKMIGKLLDSNKPYPAVGISFGLEPIYLLLKDKQARKNVSKIFVIPIKQEERCLEIVKALRKNGINSEMDLMMRAISKNLDFASKEEIPFTLIVGENEVKSGLFTLRDMTSGKEEKLGLDDIIKKLK